jgi:hypothetical protein
VGLFSLGQIGGRALEPGGGATLGPVPLGQSTCELRGEAIPLGEGILDGGVTD